MDALAILLHRSRERSGRQTVESLFLWRPDDAIALDVPLPRPHVAGFEREAQSLLAGEEGIARLTLADEQRFPLAQCLLEARRLLHRRLLVHIEQLLQRGGLRPQQRDSAQRRAG